jgi:V/A-type H+-transporting ATPase subunit D
MAIDVKPTRSELIKLKRRIKLSEKGYELLKMKRDGLIMEFSEILTQAKGVLERLKEKYGEAESKISLAKAVDGSIMVKSTALAIKSEPEFMLRSKNIMGVVVPVVKRKKVRKKLSEREYGLIGTTARIDEATAAYEELIDAILEAAEIETTLIRLLEEIESTKRRVNALEYKVIPELKEARKYIEFALEEIERDNTIRLKKIKAKA